MHEINQSTILFFATAWVIAFLSSLCRCYSDIGNKPIGNVLASCGMSGFLGFSFSILLANSGGLDGDSGATADWIYLAASAIVGIVAKEPDKIAMAMFARFSAAVNVFLSKGDDSTK